MVQKTTTKFLNRFSVPLLHKVQIRAERQMDGIIKAKQRGVKFGRRKTLNEEQIIELRNRRKDGTLIKTLMKDYNLSKATVYRYLSDIDS